MRLLTDSGKILIATAIFGFSVFLNSCRKTDSEIYAEETRFLMGSYCTIKVYSETDPEAAVNAAMERISEVYEKFNHLSEASRVYRFNNYAHPIEDEEIIALAKKSAEINAVTGGAFDITVYPLVELWGFNFSSAGVPDREEIKNVLTLVGPDKLKITGDVILKEDDNVKVTFGSIAKGYAVDEAADVLRQKGVSGALIDAGGDIYVMGEKPDGKWKVGVRHPRAGGITYVIKGSDIAVATSGDYENYFMEGEERYHHIFDPRTGYPSSVSASVTVIATDTLTADAFATAFFIMGPAGSIELAENLEGLECLIVTPDLNEYRSGGFNYYLQ